jgi:hypothetical protein
VSGGGPAGLAGGRIVGWRAWHVVCGPGWPLVCAGAKVAECLPVFASGSANQAVDDTPDLPKIWPPTPAVRTQRALRSAPIVLMRFVGMPAFAEPGASDALQHELSQPSCPGSGPPRPGAAQVTLGASARIPTGSGDPSRRGHALLTRVTRPTMAFKPPDPNRHVRHGSCMHARPGIPAAIRAPCANWRPAVTPGQQGALRPGRRGR